MASSVHRVLYSINYRLIGPLTGREAKNWATNPDFRKTHRRQFRILRNHYSQDEAAADRTAFDNLSALGCENKGAHPFNYCSCQVLAYTWRGLRKPHFSRAEGS